LVAAAFDAHSASGASQRTQLPMARQATAPRPSTSSASALRFRAFVPVSKALLEVSNSVAEALPESRYARTAEEQERDEEEHQQMSRLQFAHGAQTNHRARMFPTEPAIDVTRLAEESMRELWAQASANPRPDAVAPCCRDSRAPGATDVVPRTVNVAVGLPFGNSEWPDQTEARRSGPGELA
jgi:hypothetical protein